MRALKITLFVLLSYFASVSLAWSGEAEIRTSIAQLATAKSFPEIEKIVKELAALGDPMVNPALTALADGNLQIRKSDNAIFITRDGSSGVVLIDPVTGKEAGEAPKTDVQKIKVNNGLRRIIRDLLGNLTLQSPDTATRLQAAETIFKNSDASQLVALDAAIASEADAGVKAQMELARASAILNSDRGDDEKVEAIKLIRERGGRDALSLLTAIEAKTSGLVKDQAGAAVASIERTLAFWATGQNVWYGLSLGSVLLLAAIGLAITFGVMGVINMAHGEMVMLGAYTTFVTQDIIRENFPGLFNWSLLIALPLAFLVAAIVGVIIERGIIRHLYGRPLETLLATWGVSLILQQGVRSIFGPTNQEVGNPSWMSGSFQIGELDITWNRLWIIVFSLIVFFVLLVALNKTPLGLQMRAVTQNRRMASAMGIRTPFVDSMTFALGSGIAGIAGVALSQIDNVSPNLGQSYIIDSFMVVVFGGVGNLWGTLVGALSLGILNKFLEPFAGAVLGKILVLILIILFIQKRPRGLFALKGRAVEALILTRFFLGGFDRRISILIVLLLVMALLVPILHLIVPPTSFFYVPTFIVALLGKYLTYALLALSLDLVWGYCGILSLGHGAFFALGGYAMGMYLMRQIGSRGSYGNAELPDFMVFLNWKELPWFWYGFDHFAFAMAAAMLIPGLLAFVFGWFAFRARVTGVYLSIITQALTYALMLAFFRNNMGFGGNNGLTDFKDILGFNVQAAGTRMALFSASAVALSLGILVTSALVNSKYGKLMIGVRDAESRLRFLGYRPESIKLVAFTVSAVMAGVAGALYVPQVGIINPGEFDPGNSIEVVIWTAVGGRGTIVGPVIGALLVNAGKSWFTGVLPEFWLFALGGLFVLVTLFLPKGVVGLWDSYKAKWRAKPPAKITETAEAQT